MDLRGVLSNPPDPLRHLIRRAEARSGSASQSPELSDEVDEFVGFVALGAGVVEEVFGFFDEGALFGGAGHGEAAAAAEFEQAFVAERRLTCIG